MKVFFNPLLCSLGISLLMTGCGVTIENITPAKIPENPSGIYTISMRANVADGNVIEESIQGNIVIDGSVYPMERNPFDARLFDFDYIMPEDQNEAAFYYILDYQVAGATVPRDRQVNSQLYNFQLVNKYVLQMQVDRAPVGRSVTILGRSFFRSDRVVIGGVEAETRFRSSNEIEFTVPPLPSEQSYFVQLFTDGQMVPVGNFMVDSSVMRVAPRNVNIAVGETAVLVLSVDFEAPRGGLNVEITTDIPNSIIMPEVSFPSGSRSVSVEIEGAAPGQGAIYAEVPGIKEVVIPVTITP